MPLLTMLIPVLTQIGEAVVSGFITHDTGAQYARMALRAVNYVNTAEANLQLIGDTMEAGIELAKAEGKVWEPKESEIKAIWDQIHNNDAEWENLQK